LLHHELKGRTSPTATAVTLWPVLRISSASLARRLPPEKALWVEEEAPARGACAFAAMNACVAFDQTAGEDSFLGFGRHGDTKILICGHSYKSTSSPQTTVCRGDRSLDGGPIAEAVAKGHGAGNRRVATCRPGLRTIQGSFSRDLEAD
jgi:hypothetical protein